MVAPAPQLGPSSEARRGTLAAALTGLLLGLARFPQSASADEPVDASNYMEFTEKAEQVLEKQMTLRKQAKAQRTKKIAVQLEACKKCRDAEVKLLVESLHNDDLDEKPDSCDQCMAG
eukprot:CAMPEP_0197691812 /NCGR_PEP_ID=MMETSP1338-20131121/110238_1 /TAXON_ID=43686 ORGANISM="Pelagodinium beii, Strain RCC1491" /NCGR_SAMPLE_ID=MMETSP1338 /ASSEMBLY_ACC=CAM_ASM_000754 /LENGTH=117 /DNA_ID=CAMNT_0043274405 /DNA_START=14 /DNA_END=367 /DNA_ORIENTATION=+